MFWLFLPTLNCELLLADLPQLLQFVRLSAYRWAQKRATERFSSPAALFYIYDLAPFVCELLKTPFHHQRIISALCRKLVVMPWVLIAFHRMENHHRQLVLAIGIAAQQIFRIRQRR